ncbi:hypothetical protein MNB_SV-13-1856 [hydrothermal vent metagenome]|uniref:Uncharacterized protein n=1 Tax=hydrothermal vent metagenome TaxID=652676 RepID=A0A1W1C9L5_9ZZZZ
MKNLIENVALLLVVLLMIAIVFFIVQFNLIEDENTFEVLKTEQNTSMKNTVKRKSYLNTLEGYGNDTEVNVDARKENDINIVRIQSELSDDILGDTIDDSSKNAYTQNIEKYSDSASKEDNTGKAKKVEKEKNLEEVGLAIDALDL